MCVVFCVGLCVFGMKEVGKEKGRRERYIYRLFVYNIPFFLLSKPRIMPYANVMITSPFSDC